MTDSGAPANVADATISKSSRSEVLLVAFSIAWLSAGALIAVSTVALMLLLALGEKNAPHVDTFSLAWLCYSLPWMASGIVGLIYRNRPWITWVLVFPIILTAFLAVFLAFTLYADYTAWWDKTYGGYEPHK